MLDKIINLDFVENMQFHPYDPKEKGIDGGIYRLYDKDGEVVYVGKSMNLHRRLDDHVDLRSHISYFMPEVEHIEYFTEPNPILETLLEGIFIAYHRPKYNDEVKDARKKLGDDYALF